MKAVTNGQENSYYYQQHWPGIQPFGHGNKESFHHSSNTYDQDDHTGPHTAISTMVGTHSISMSIPSFPASFFAAVSRGVLKICHAYNFTQNYRQDSK